WGALGALALALGATPIGRLGRALGRRWRVAPARRALGLAAAALATLHAGAALWGPLAGAWDALFGWPYLRAGALALAVLLALALTSFPRAVKALRVRHWKALHRLAYPAAGLAFVHVLLGPFAPRRWALGLLGALLVTQLLRALPERPRGETAPSA
ncbi:MAG TPA: ferric reductase-like transmembrane domain-containing protein, partial [Polyangiaceae bacterium LLY-WYZ-15_(1-7)]|nr:ferric reductase-like transmembrane domain-containing protein [Polyangiaceae bacterium LLY-WYZ-15_(1-7)]